MNSIELINISKSFDDLKAVDNITLSVPEGSIYGFIGPNGSGKTTTIRMIMNILYPDEGSISLFGKSHFGGRIDNIGYLPEERGLYKKMKVKEIIHFHAELKNTKRIKEGTNYWLEKFALKEFENKKVETLSKGMSQKLQFIITIIDKPDIIILDEPFSGLDPVNAEMIKSVILDLKNKGATIIFSTHDMEMAEKMCNYIFMIHKGKKVLDGTLQDIQDRFGTDTIRIQPENGIINYNDIPGIEKVNDFGQIQEIKISPEIDAQDILKKIISKTRLRKFEITKPSLHDIFIRIAGHEEKEVTNA